jgi:membrane dipeptidase
VSVPIIPGIVEAMKYIKAIVGVQYIALGSDYDGSIKAPFDITGLPLLVEEMIKQGFSKFEIEAIMGGNMKRFMLKNLR